MNALQTHQALLAATDRRAVAKTTRRHVHLSPRPLVLAGYHLAGDPGAPLALMWGTSRDQEPRCMVVPSPATVDSGLRPSTSSPRSSSPISPSSRTATSLATVWMHHSSSFPCRHRRLAWRDRRPLYTQPRTDGDAPAPPAVPLAGKHLSFFADLMPGSSLVLAATEIVLTTHWQTGQLPSEDLNLAALLGWIDPPAGMDSPQAAREGEASPPAGRELPSPLGR